MARPEFAQLVTSLLEAMGQSMAAVRQVAEGLLVRTTDGFLYGFVEDPNRVSLEFILRLEAEVENVGARLVVLAPSRLPLALTQEVLRRGGSVVDGGRFHELVGGLGLGPLLGDAPPATDARGRERLLPSARQLDDVMGRARAWSEWGIPALALRFYHQAAQMKPEFLPAQNGIAQSLLALGLHKEAGIALDAILATDPANVDARIGKAALLGATGQTAEEIRAYRELLGEEPGRQPVRAHLIAALIDTQSWAEARHEVEAMLEMTPEDPRLRLLHAATMARTGEASAAESERSRARALGLTYEAERGMARQLGLPAPPAPTREPAGVVAAPPPVVASPTRSATPPGAPEHPSEAAAPSPTVRSRSQAGTPPRRGRARRRKASPAARKPKKAPAR